MKFKTKITIKQNNITTNEVVLEPIQTAKVAAAENMQVSLSDIETGNPITKLQAKKSGNDLVIADESGRELLTIENYYSFNNIEVGTLTNESFVKLTAVDPVNGETVSSISETSYTPLIADMLDNATIDATTATNGLSNGALWGSLGAIAIGAVAINSSDDDNNNTPVDKTPPSSLTQILAENNQVIIGKTEAGATVTATYNGKVVGTVIARGDGSYTLNLDKAYTNGEAIEVTAADKAGNTTKPNTVTAPDTTAPNSLTQEISADGKVVSGTTEAGATVMVTHNGEVVGTAVVKQDGSYSVSLDPAFNNGEALEVTVKDVAGNTTEPNALTAPDITAPSGLTQELGADNQIITGKTEAGATVTATYNGKVVGTVIAKEDGSYTLNLDKAYTNGEAIEVTAADKAGNTTKLNTVSAPDITAPNSLTQEISADGKVVSGTTEAGATVTVTYSGQVLGEEQADADGNYSIKLDNKFSGSEELQVTATDAVDNSTEPNTIIAPDNTAPSSLTQILAENNQVIIGKTEAGATVTATYNGKVVGTVIARGDGSYTLNLDKAYTNGEAIEVTAADKAGNTTKPGSVYANIDALNTESISMSVAPEFETRIETEQQTVIDKSSYGWISEYFTFEVTGSNASLQLDVINPNRVINANYSISLSGPGISSSNSGNISSVGSTVYPIDLDIGTLSPGSYNMNLRVNASGSNVQFKVTEYVEAEYQDFVGYSKVSGSIFGDNGSPENYELKVDGQSLVYKASETTINSITLETANGVLDLSADGSFTYTSNHLESSLGASQLEDSFDIEVYDLNGDSSGVIDLNIVPDVNYGDHFVYFDGEAFIGSEGNDILTTDESITLLSGKGGDDVYVYTQSYDRSTFPYYSTIVDTQGDDAIKLVDIDPSSVNLRQNGEDLIVDLILAYGGEITVQNHFGKGSINNIYFDNGDSWSRMDIESMANASVI